MENGNGPAALAGIQPGDVIVSVGTTKLTTIGGRQQVDKAGKHIALLIERNGQKIFVRCASAEAPTTNPGSAGKAGTPISAAFFPASAMRPRSIA
ncbi:MAG: PDZ domain-containing protein [Candidatus Tumulicola sp.]